MCLPRPFNRTLTSHGSSNILLESIVKILVNGNVSQQQLTENLSSLTFTFRKNVVKDQAHASRCKRTI